MVVQPMMSFNFNNLIRFVFILCLIIPAQSTFAQSAAEKGRQIAVAAYEADKGFGNFTADLTMILRDKLGRENKRSLRIQLLEVLNDGDKVLLIFDNPRDVKGTAFLTHSHRNKPNDQWLYLPALKRVKRISSSKQSGSFMGSEFSYNDLNNPEIDKYKYTWIEDKACGNLVCTVTEWVPVEKDSGYSRQLVWHDKDELRIWKIEYFDRRNSHIKTLIYEDYNEHLGEYWRANKLLMKNHLTGKSTDLIWSNFKFRTNLNENDFSEAGLRRVR